MSSVVPSNNPLESHNFQKKIGPYSNPIYSILTNYTAASNR